MSEATDKRQFLGMEGVKTLLAGLEGEYSPLEHAHDDLIESIEKITDGTTTVAQATEATHSSTSDEATHAESADHATSADSATKATQDAEGNVITETYAKIEDIPEPDWNENDETSKNFVKNRTHYTETEESTVQLLEEKVYDGFTLHSYFGKMNLEIIPPAFVLEAGKTYTVTLNGTTYKDLVCYSNDDTMNEPMLGDTPHTVGTNYPFSIWNETEEGTEGLYIMVDDAENTSHTVGITTVEVVETVHQLDEKYIPDTIARVSDLPEFPTTQDAIDLAVETGLVEPATDNEGTIFTDVDGDIYSI